MDLQQVEVKGLYKKQYIKHENSIYDVAYLKSLKTYENFNFEELKNSGAKFLFSKSFVYPSNQKMEAKLEKRRQEIYALLKLNEITGNDADVVKAFVLFKYLSNQVEYNMMALEKRTKPTALYKKLETVLNEKNKSARYIGYKLHEVPEYKNIAEKLYEKETDLLHRARLTKIYNALIYNEGVCGDITYAYNYLLNGLNIETCVCDFKTEIRGYRHIFSVVKRQNKNSYYFVDATFAAGKPEVNETYGFGFDVNFHNGLNYDDENSSVKMKEVGVVLLNGKRKLREVTLTPKEMVEKFKKLEALKAFSTPVENAVQFMQNGYAINKINTEYER